MFCLIYRSQGAEVDNILEVGAENNEGIRIKKKGLMGRSWTYAFLLLGTIISDNIINRSYIHILMINCICMNEANQALTTLAFFGVGVNLVLFLTRVMEQSNATAANNVSIWTGTVYLCSLVGAFLSDSYWGRYITCALFQVVLVVVCMLLNSQLSAIQHSVK